MLNNLLCQNRILPIVQQANNDTLKRDTDYLFQSCTISGIAQNTHTNYQNFLLFIEFSKQFVFIGYKLHHFLINSFYSLASHANQSYAQSFSSLGSVVCELVVTISPDGIIIYPVRADCSTITGLGLLVPVLFWEFCQMSLWPVNSKLCPLSVVHSPRSEIIEAFQALNPNKAILPSNLFF